MRKKTKVYAVSLAVSLGTGIASAIVTSKSMEIYKTLKQPPLAPPPAVFPAVWTALFILMGISYAKVYLNKSKDEKKAKGVSDIYGTSLAVNFLWSLIFFKLHAYWAAFLWLLLLWGLILVTVTKYRMFSKTAAYLQIPYLLWVSFAGYLNCAIALLN